mgnify:FL=1
MVITKPMCTVRNDLSVYTARIQINIMIIDVIKDKMYFLNIAKSIRAILPAIRIIAITKGVVQAMPLSFADIITGM